MSDFTSPQFNQQQASCFEQITRSILEINSNVRTHILKGSAGTGKTFWFLKSYCGSAGKLVLLTCYGNRGTGQAVYGG